MEIVEEREAPPDEKKKKMAEDHSVSDNIFIVDSSQEIPTIKMGFNEIKEEVEFSDGSEYSVEDIEDKRVFKGRVKYLVKWRGYEERTWEKVENMYCEQLIKEFENRRKLQTNEQKPKTGKQSGQDSKKMGKLSVDLSKQQRKKVSKRRSSTAQRNSNQTARRANTPTEAYVDGVKVSIKRNEKSLKRNNGVKTKFMPLKTKGTNKPRSVSHNVNSWVKNGPFQSEGGIDINNGAFCGSCGSPVVSKHSPVEKKRKRSTSSDCSKTRRGSRRRSTPLRHSAATSPMFGSPLCGASTSKKPRTAERIIGARLIREEIMFLVKWEGSDLPDWIPSTIGSLQFPQLVIKYYEDRLMWNTSSAESTPR